jgi:hypothetical protein
MLGQAGATDVHLAQAIERHRTGKEGSCEAEVGVRVYDSWILQRPGGALFMGIEAFVPGS